MPTTESPSADVPLAPYGPLPPDGDIRPITRWGTPVMHRVNTPVTAYDEDLTRLVADMVATMYAADGVGLAACQIGVDAAVFCFDCPDEDGQRVVGVICNPELALPEGDERHLDDDDEGCLSYPGAFVPCARPDVATVTGTGLDGSTVTFTGTGLLARCLQHETDHTVGIVFGDRLPTKQRKRLARDHDLAVDDHPDGWPA